MRDGPLDLKHSDREGRAKSPFVRRALVLTVLSLALGLAIAASVWQARRPLNRGLATTEQRTSASSIGERWKNTSPHVKYVGDAACARCHGEIVETYRRHPMGRSLAPIAQHPRSAVRGPTAW